MPRPVVFTVEYVSICGPFLSAAIRPRSLNDQIPQRPIPTPCPKTAATSTHAMPTSSGKAALPTMRFTWHLAIHINSDRTKSEQYFHELAF